jgi:hypothetical protein
VIITLSHLSQVNYRAINEEHDDLFVGLGVESRSRHRLVHLANRFDYLGAENGEIEYLQILESEVHCEGMKRNMQMR